MHLSSKYDNLLAMAFYHQNFILKYLLFATDFNQIWHAWKICKPYVETFWKGSIQLSLKYGNFGRGFLPLKLPFWYFPRFLQIWHVGKICEASVNQEKLFSFNWVKESWRIRYCWTHDAGWKTQFCRLIFSCISIVWFKIENWCRWSSGLILWYQKSIKHWLSFSLSNVVISIIV